MYKMTEMGDPSEITSLVARHAKEIEISENAFESELKELRLKQRKEYHDFVMNFYNIEFQKTPSSPSLRSPWILSTPERSPSLVRSSMSNTPASPSSSNVSPAQKKNRMSFFRRKSKLVENQTLIGQSKSEDASKL